MDAIDKINARLEKLRETVSHLHAMGRITPEELIQNIDIQTKAERLLQLAIEAVIDIAELIISDQRLRTPAESREAILILAEANILDKAFAEDFSKIAGFRNILVHNYMSIDYTLVADKINNKLSLSKINGGFQRKKLDFQ